MTCRRIGVYRDDSNPGTVDHVNTPTLPAQSTTATAPPRAGVVARVTPFVPPLAAAGLAMALAPVVPLLSPLLLALVVGAVVANSPLMGVRAVVDHGPATRLLLRLGVAALGLQLPFGDIVGIGPVGLVVIVTTVAVTFRTTLAVGRRLGLDEGFVVLLSAGFSICGAAAIAGVQDSVRAKEKFVALAVAMVTIFGSAMIVLVPWLAGVIGLTDHQAAIWAGASIHEVAQVAAAGSLIGGPAVALAMTVKLGRVALLAPISALLAKGAKGVSAPLVPWFIVAFAVAVAVRSTGLLPASVLEGTDLATTLLLAAGMYGLGMGIRARDLWPLPVQALTLATVSTLVAGGTSLALVMTLA